MYEFYPFPTVESAKKVQENMDRVLKASKGKKVYLYGAGLMGRPFSILYSKISSKIF
jgi:hypothetical protein